MSQVYKTERAEIWCGDSAEIVPRLGYAVDAVLTDGPYGVKQNTNYKRFTGGLAEKNTFESIANDDRPFDPQPWLAYPKCVLWGFNCFNDRVPPGSCLVWCKRRESKVGKFLSDCEVAWMKGGYGAYLFHHVWDGFDRETERGKSVHPTQKPVELMKWCIEKMKLAPNSLILDPFMGSGPVARACKELGHRYVGIELKPEYCNTAIKRLEGNSGV